MRQVAWLASYPRSGNTWTRVLLASYLADASMTSIASPEEALDEAIPDIHVLLSAGRMIPFNEDGRPTIVKSHFLPDADLMQVHRSSTTKVIYLLRNPRDVLHSTIPHLGIGKEYAADYAKSFIENRGAPVWTEGWGTWLSSVREWSDPENVSRHFPNAELLVVRYEDLRAETPQRLQMILEFLDLGPVDPARVRRAAENSSLRRMQATEQELVASGLIPAGQNRFVGEGLQNQSLASLGSDVEIAYQEMLKKDEEFFEYVRRFKYEA
ncbi:sulfotransferase domain-containing protein [Micromonospora sp. NBC_01699]|uniref:sulfotransferase domain-containing protein n=1 Tax=Micromonospora sp. NBC_01699 TaxID=2975984 RepID=UPI002E2992BC|nr:sulfotransferase domain-containing protein [Micromonospora sp. NBC_01699]